MQSATQIPTSTADALKACRPLILIAIGFGVAVNLLILAGPLYMLQVYDRVLGSSSVETLVALTILMVGAYAALGLIDAARGMLASHVGLRLDRLLGERLVSMAWQDPKDRSVHKGGALLQDLDTYRGFVGGQGLIAAIDLPFAPLFLLVIFLLHPLLGAFAIAAALMLAALAFLTQVFTKPATQEAMKHQRTNMRSISNVAQAGESVQTLGMIGTLLARWQGERNEVVSKKASAGERTAGFKAITKALRMMVQSLILGLGAWLVLQAELSPGGMIAASIILGRALAPIEQALALWSGYNASKAAKASLDEALEGYAEQVQGARAKLPEIEGAIAFENVTFRHTGAREATLNQVTLTIPAGSSVGICGPSGVGKSTLGRLILGAVKPNVGTIRIDGADIQHYDRDHLGQQVGYLSQSVDLLPGSVAENIARFQDVEEDKVFEAAQNAGVHDMILRLPDGYSTQIGEMGQGLSGGQKQLVGLARAVYGDPKILLLDEPNANLDQVGEGALAHAVRTAHARGATVLVITHKAAILNAMDLILALNEGGTGMFGPRDNVMPKLLGNGGGADSGAKERPERQVRDEKNARIPA